MKFGVRAKLFIVTVALILVGGVVAGVWLQGELAEYLETQTRTELRRAALATQVVIAELPQPLSREIVDHIVDQLGEAEELRITVVAPDGSVLGDSEFSGRELAKLESHADRPEILEARSEGFGVSGRFSRSVKTEMLYVAVAEPESPLRPAIRTSRRLSSLRASLARIRWLLVGAAGLLAIIATLISALASWFMSRSVNRVLAAAQSIRADRNERMNPNDVGDFSELAISVNHVLDDLQGTMSALESQNERMGAVLQGMSEPVLALNTEQIITLSNRAVMDVLGLTDDPAGRLLSDVLPSPDLEQLDFSGVGLGPSTVEIEFGHQRLLAQATRQSDGSGSVLVLHDITGIRRLEKMRRDFVANVSHELRTPVAVLQANAETLLDGALDEPTIAEKLVEAIHRQSGRLGSLVADLLDISRIEAGQYNLRQEPVPVEELCRQSLEAMERPATARRVALRLESPGRVFVLGDGKATEQILTNLLDNAIKYGKANGRVTLRVTQQVDSIRFEVEDDGPGIERRHHARLFERFYRVDKGRSRGMGGTGLGLSIVKHLVESMDGRLGYRTAEPRGSVFWFELPRVGGITTRADS